MANQQLTVRDLLGILRRRWHLIGVTALLLALLAALFTFTRTPLYQSESTILLNQQRASDIFDPLRQLSGSRFVENEAEFVRSKVVYDEFVERTGLESEIRVVPFENADVLELTAIADDPDVAAGIANEYAKRQKL